MDMHTHECISFSSHLLHTGCIVSTGKGNFLLLFINLKPETTNRFQLSIPSLGVKSLNSLSKTIAIGH